MFYKLADNKHAHCLVYKITRVFTRSKYISRVHIVLGIQLDLKWAFDIPTLFWEGSRASMAAFERF